MNWLKTSGKISFVSILPDVKLFTVEAFNQNKLNVSCLKWYSKNDIRGVKMKQTGDVRI